MRSRDDVALITLKTPGTVDMPAIMVSSGHLVWDGHQMRLELVGQGGIEPPTHGFSVRACEPERPAACGF